jgi:hypothetical protein
MVPDPFKTHADAATAQQRRLERWISSQESRGKLRAPERLQILEVRERE